MATDPDGNIVSYKWQQTSGVQLTLTSNNTDKLSLITPLVTRNERAELQAVVTDNHGGIATATVVLTISNNNNVLLWPNATSSANSDQWLLDHHDKITELRPRVLVLNPANSYPLNYVEEDVNALAHAFAEHIAWEDPDSPGHNMTLCELVERGYVNEIWTVGEPNVTFESQAHQQKYDDNLQPIAGQFNDCSNGCLILGYAGQCKVTFRMSQVNPRQGTGCDIHAHSHAKHG